MFRVKGELSQCTRSWTGSLPSVLSSGINKIPLRKLTITAQLAREVFQFSEITMIAVLPAGSEALEYLGSEVRPMCSWLDL